jgi:competence CoiA-like predicted nuclease
MLVGLCEENRITAAAAQRGAAYHCPNCSKPLVLKKGRVVIHHFAHKPPILCDWARGETLAHLEAKRLVHAALTARGVRAELEYSLETLPGDRRADVMAWSPKGQMIAIELQHTSISAELIAERAFAYARAGAAQIWISFLPASVWKEALDKGDGTWLVRRYAPRQFEHWIDGLTAKAGRWMYDPQSRQFWLAKMARHEILEEETIWYAPGGIEHFRAARKRVSKKYRDLVLRGPFKMEELRIALRKRRQFSAGGMRWPQASLAELAQLQEAQP